jgi:signal transduction histidine kinase
MKQNRINKFFSNFLLSIIIFSLVLTSMFIYFQYQKKTQIDNYLNDLKKQYQIQYKITLEHFNILAQNSFYGIINKPEIYNYVKYAYKKDDKTQKINRGLLYDKLISDYNRFVDLKFQQLQFHFPDNVSFLRMYKKENFGEDTTNSRFIINEVNKKLKPLSGFEIGKTVDGFRFVYPLFDENLFHIGSVEFSIDSDSFDKVFEENYDLDSHFLINKELAEKQILPKYLSKFEASFENDDYVFFEDRESEDRHYARNNFFNKHEKELINHIMKKNEDLILYKQVDGKYLSIYFMPIKNSNNAAYMVLYKEAFLIQQLVYNFYKILIILFISIIIFIIYLNYRYNQINEYNNRSYLLSQQSKMAAIGEMIENIAHQWRQPLSVISVAASGMKIKKEFNILDDKAFISSINSILRNVDYLSNTIEDFRNYFNDNLEKKNFNLKDTILQSISLFESDLTYKDIKIIKNIDNISVFSYESEIKQVIINILRNAKDFATNGVLIINAHENKNEIRIDIQDSAGGISLDIIKKIFEPYFTTKHQSYGVGLGLYMAYEIVNKSLKGNLLVENREFEYNFAKFTGACFSIILFRDKL